MKNNDQEIIDFSRKYFEYRNGNLYWLERPATHFKDEKYSKMWNTKYVGKLAGATTYQGYLQVRVLSSLVRAHRVIFGIHHGYIPDEIDHINGIKSDNRIENLRECTRSQNNYNKPLQSNNRTGHKCINWDDKNKRWRVVIKAAGKSRYLGIFADLESAIATRDMAHMSLHGDFYRIKEPPNA